MAYDRRWKKRCPFDDLTFLRDGAYRGIVAVTLDGRVSSVVDGDVERHITVKEATRRVEDETQDQEDDDGD